MLLLCINDIIFYQQLGEKFDYYVNNNESNLKIYQSLIKFKKKHV